VFSAFAAKDVYSDSIHIEMSSTRNGRYTLQKSSTMYS